MEQNPDVFDFMLTDEDMSRIASMDTGASLLLTTATPPWSAGSTAARRSDPPEDAYTGRTKVAGQPRRAGAAPLFRPGIYN